MPVAVTVGFEPDRPHRNVGPYGNRPRRTRHQTTRQATPSPPRFSDVVGRMWAGGPSSPPRPILERMFEVVEWEVRHPLDGAMIAIIRLVHLGPAREPYYRAVTANPDPAQRRLIGYYGSAQDAHDASMYMLEQATGTGVSGGGEAAIGSVRRAEASPYRCGLTSGRSAAFSDRHPARSSSSTSAGSGASAGRSSSGSVMRARYACPGARRRPRRPHQRGRGQCRLGVLLLRRIHRVVRIPPEDVEDVLTQHAVQSWPSAASQSRQFGEVVAFDLLEPVADLLW